MHLAAASLNEDRKTELDYQQHFGDPSNGIVPKVELA